MFGVRRFVSMVDRTWEFINPTFSSSLGLTVLFIKKATIDPHALVSYQSTMILFYIIIIIGISFWFKNTLFFHDEVVVNDGVIFSPSNSSWLSCIGCAFCSPYFGGGGSVGSCPLVKLISVVSPSEFFTTPTSCLIFIACFPSIS